MGRRNWQRNQADSVKKSPREVRCEVSSDIAGEVGTDHGFVVTSTMSTRAAAGPAVPEELTDGWSALSEHLAGVAQDVAGVELMTSTRMALVEMTVELLVLVTCWPGSPPPASPLAYLRTRRARMARHAGWLYALPPPARSLLVGTGRRPSLVAFAVKSQPIDNRLRRAWRRGLVAFAEHVASLESWPGERSGPSERVAGPAPPSQEPAGSSREGEPGAGAVTKRAPERASVCLPYRRHLGLARRTGPRKANTALSRRLVALRPTCGLARELTARDRGHASGPASPRSGRSPPQPTPTLVCLVPTPALPVSQPPLCRAPPTRASRPEALSPGPRAQTGRAVKTGSRREVAPPMKVRHPCCGFANSITAFLV